jgi:hypothetical protein
MHIYIYTYIYIYIYIYIHTCIYIYIYIPVNVIQRLLEDDDCIDNNAVLRADDAVDEDRDIQLGAHLGNVVVHADCVDSSHESSEPEAIKILKLQIELEKIKLQESQAGMNIDSVDSSLIGDKLDMGSIKVRLPVMSPDCDDIAFFMMFEKTLELNAVPKELWPDFCCQFLTKEPAKYSLNNRLIVVATTTNRVRFW